jgi:hypothetical protein
MAPIPGDSCGWFIHVYPKIGGNYSHVFLQFDTGENDDNHPMFRLNLEFLSTCCYEATDRAVPSSASCTRKGCGQHEIEPHTFQRQLQNLPGESLVTDPKQHEITWKTLG